jgi:hypothetical protein
MVIDDGPGDWEPAIAPSGPFAHPRSRLWALAASRWMLAVWCASALALGILLWITSEDVPRADEWSTPGGYLVAQADGTVDFQKHLFRQHNESRVIFAQLLAGLIASRWGWNQHIFHALNWLITVLTAFLFVRLTSRILSLDRRLPWPAVLILCSAVALIFTPIQWRNFLSSGQIITIGIPCLLLAGISINTQAHLPSWIRYLTAALFSLLASFSFVNGLLLWFLLWPLPFVMVQEARWRVRRSELLGSAAYFAVAIAIVVTFFADYHTPPGHPSLFSGLRAPHRTLFFAATWLAGPIFSEPLAFWQGKGHWVPFWISGMTAGATGLLLLATFAALRRAILSAPLVRRIFPLLPLLAYSLLSAASISMARVALGLFGNLSRYSTVAIPAFLAMASTLAVVSEDAPPGRARRLLPVLAVTFAMSVLLGGLAGGMGCLVDQQAARQAALSLAFRHLAPDDPLLTNVFPDPRQLVPLADRLEQRGLRPHGPDFAWILRAVPSPRADITYQIHAEEGPALRFIAGRVSPSAPLRRDDVLVVWNEASARPVTALLAPTPGNYPGKPDGVFEVSYDKALAEPIGLQGERLYLARPSTHELWQLARAD